MKKGTKVVCIDDNFHEETKKRVRHLPKLNNTYTIRDYYPTQNGDAVLLKEIVNPTLSLGEGENGYNFEPNFRSSRFKELDEFDLQSELREIKELELELV